MADVNSVVEEKVKFRDGKKWKARWCVLKKPSPVADRLQVLLYKCIKDVIKGESPKQSFYLEEFYGLETRFSFDKENNVLAIICQKQITTFAFESREALIKFEIKIRTAIGEENQFNVHLKRVPPQSKLPLEKMRMHIHGQKFCLTQQSPPKMVASWIISDLRKFGKLDGKFVFEGGSRCGKVAGVHIIQSEQVDDIEEIIQLASQGKTASCRKSNKRRSQNCDYLDPVTKSVSSNLCKNSVPASPGSYDGRSWRHSFSVSNNSGWMSNSNFGSAAKYSSQLRSIENLEREKLMALYDVPPRRIRKVESPKSPSQEEKPGSGDSLQHSSRVNLPDNRHDMSLDHSSSSLSLASCESSPTYLGCKASVSASAPALCGYGAYSPFNDKYKNISCSVPDHIDELEELDREEALECLQREERGLQREISLLDEMLQGCQNDTSRKGRSKRDKNKPPPIPRKFHKPSRRPDNIPLSLNYGSYYDNSLLSPNLASKLQKIPSNSKLSAPLPYVNLEKYDIGDVDNSHVHVSSTCADSGNWSAPCVSSGRKHSSRRSGPNKENVKGSPRQYRNSVHCLKGKSSSESELSCRSVSSATKEENIYENDFPRRAESPTPPALPPKGPALLQKNKNRCEVDEVPPVPPQRPPRKPIVDPKSFYQNPRRIGDQARCESSTGPTDTYLMMAGFEREEKKLNSEPIHCREVVKLPPRKVASRSEEQQQSSMASQGAYMEMGSIFQSEKDFTERQCDPLHAHEHRLQYGRSFSTSDVLDEDHLNSSSLNQSYNTSSNTSLIREENYLVMTNFKTQKKSDSVESCPRRHHQSIDLTGQGSTLSLKMNTEDTSFSSGSSDASDIDRTAIPFPNLMNFQQHNTTSKTKSVKNSTSGSSTTTTTGVHNDKGNSTEGSSKNTGFLTRIIRRNSGNRKSMSQSRENLLASSSSESCLERTVYQSSKDAVLTRVVSQSSDSSSSSCGHHPSPTLPLSDHRRSSSFPNRASFFDKPNSTSEKERGFHQGMQGNYFSSLSLDDQMQLLECDNEFTGSESSSLNDLSKSSRSQSGYMGPCESTGSENGDDDLEHLSEKKKLLLCTKHKKYKSHEPKIFTVLQSDDRKLLGSGSDSSSKTDDEKLIELFKHGAKTSLDDQHLYKTKSQYMKEYKKRHSLPTDGSKSRSPKEEALAIVKHVSSLPPFVPPKLKHYPCPLSPVPESVPTMSKGEDTPPSQNSFVSQSTLVDTPKRTGVDPVFQKELARATLRIQPPPPLLEEDENVWVPRDSSNSQEGKSDNDTGQTEQFKALVVDVEEDCEQDDAISMSSLDSSLPSCDESIRTSPASTLLRPRSGKEYKMVERRRAHNDSLSSSPAQTPQSPSDTVFTFESCSPSQTSVFSRERESPNIPKFSRTDSSVSSRIYERISPPRTYVNIDMTPPSSPLYTMSLPPEQIEPQLNYAEIDLSHSSNIRASKKSRKSSQKSSKSNTIEYALIDMEATVAIQRAGREHAQSREDSLRRSDKKLSLSNREQKLSLSESGTTDLSLSSIEHTPSPDKSLRESPERSLRETPDRSLKEFSDRHYQESSDRSLFENPDDSARDEFASPEDPIVESSPSPEPMTPEDTLLPERRTSYTSSSSSEEEEEEEEEDEED